MKRYTVGDVVLCVAAVAAVAILAAIIASITCGPPADLMDFETMTK